MIHLVCIVWCFAAPICLGAAFVTVMGLMGDDGGYDVLLMKGMGVWSEMRRIVDFTLNY